MIRWSICTTLRAPEDAVRGFIAHHLALGPERIWLHFDDPDDPAAAVAGTYPRVKVQRCGPGYWRNLLGRRPAQHQRRQMFNVGRVWAKGGVEFVLHIDVDELLIADRPVADCLADLDPERAVLRVEPWEALHDPALPPGPFAARHFRRALPPGSVALGPYAALLPSGMLSHTAGKCFFRTGVAGLVPNIHGARIEGERVPGGRFHPDLALLHFHAHDPAAWQAALPFRLTKGAYMFNPALQAHLAAADAAGVAAFYEAVQVARPEYLAALAAEGALREVTLPAPRPGAGPRSQAG